MAIANRDVKRWCADAGFDLVGVTLAVPAAGHAFTQAWIDRGYAAGMDYMANSMPLRSDPRSLLPSAQTIVMVGLNYQQPLNPPDQIKIARYALGRDYHKVIRSKLKRVARQIESTYQGECRVCVDSAPLYEREYAVMAGLGWLGKNTCLIDSHRGSWFLLGALLTSVNFETDSPAVGGCGTCTACIDACPTGAIVHDGGRWQVDSRRCISYLTIEHRGEIDPELADKTEDWVFGCDICQEVCPFNHARESQPLRAAPASDPEITATRQWPSLKACAELSDEEWDRLTQGSPVRRAKLDGLRRNALLVLNRVARRGSMDQSV